MLKSFVSDEGRGVKLEISMPFKCVKGKVTAIKTDIQALSILSICSLLQYLHMGFSEKYFSTTFKFTTC